MRAVFAGLRPILALGLLTVCGEVIAQSPTDAISREFTVWVDNTSYPPITDFVSREFTVYVGTQPLRHQTDFVAREFTVFNDSVVGTGQTDAVSREFTVYFGTQPLRQQTDAVTRELSVYYDPYAELIRDAFSQEATIYIGTQPLREQTDCVTREFTVFASFGLGDLNCDGVLNGRDIDPFVVALLDPALYVTQFPDCDISRGDIDSNAVMDENDVYYFTLFLLSSP